MKQLLFLIISYIFLLLFNLNKLIQQYITICLKISLTLPFIINEEGFVKRFDKSIGFFFYYKCGMIFSKWNCNLINQLIILIKQNIILIVSICNLSSLNQHNV